MSSNEVPLSFILGELFNKYKASYTNVNVTDVYINLRIVLSQTSLTFCFSTSNRVLMRNESINDLISLLDGIEEPILGQHSYKPLSNKELAAVVRNPTKNIDCQLGTFLANFHQHCC